jgi:hypothetical protein
MTNNIIDDNVKSFLIACLVGGIHVEDESRAFMIGLVEHMNNLEERSYWTVGDEDGIIIHDKLDIPILSLTYKNHVLKFGLVSDPNDPFDSDLNRDVGYMLLNVLGYIQSLGLECEPEAFRVQRVTVQPNTEDDTDDWSL